MRSIVAGVLLGLGLMAGTASAQAPDPKVAHADYTNNALWLCKPGLKDDKCKVDLTATVIPGNGKTTVEKFIVAKDPKIDCFPRSGPISCAPGSTLS